MPPRRRPPRGRAPPPPADSAPPRPRRRAAGEVGVSVLEPAVASFARRHPEVHVEAVLTGRVVDVVEEGFDLALRAGPLRGGSPRARKLGQIVSAVVATAPHL